MALGAYNTYNQAQAAIANPTGFSAEFSLGVSKSQSSSTQTTATLQSGADTTLQGAVVQANTVKADVGGNLNLQSQQDTSDYASKSSSVGGSLTLSPAPGGSLSVGKTTINSTYASVTEQSGIKA